MTWICDFGVVNCPVCQRARQDIKSMLPNIPDSIIDRAIKEQKIDLHQAIEEISIEITTDGKPKIEVKGDKDRKSKVNIPSFTGTIWETKTANNTEPWDISKDIERLSSRLTGIPFTTSIEEGDLPPMYTPRPLGREYFGSDDMSFSFEADGPIGPQGLDWPAYPSDYRLIGGGTKKIQEPQKVDKLVPTSKLYKDIKKNDEVEFYRKQGIRSYRSSDGKNTMIVNSKSEIQY